MHWVMCTTIDGKKTPVNLALVFQMLAIREDKDGGIWFTRLFLSGDGVVRTNPDGSTWIQYPISDVRETPEQILHLPPVALGPLRLTGPSPAEGVVFGVGVERSPTTARPPRGKPAVRDETVSGEPPTEMRPRNLYGPATKPHRGKPHPKQGKPDAKIGPSGRSK